MPQAACNALVKLNFCLSKIIVSSAILVSSQFIIAKIIIPITGKDIPLNWKNNIVPKSPIEQPITHHIVFFALLFQVCLQDQLKLTAVSINWIYLSFLIMKQFH